MSRRINPEIESQVVAMIAAGHTMTAIEEKMGISYDTLRTIKKRSKVKRGEAQAELVEVQKEVLMQALSSENVKQETAALITDEILIARKVKAKVNQLIDQLPTNSKDAKEIASIARALSALATAQKLSSDSLRSTLKLGAQPDDIEELPILIVREMLQSEVDEIRDKQEQEYLEMIKE